MQRLDFSELVESDWKKKPTLKKIYLEESKKDILSKGGFRTFDYVEHLVDKTDQDKLLASLTSIVKYYYWRDSSTNYTQITNWYASITDLAIAALLDEKGEVKQKILDLFQWNEVKDKINTMHLVCAFVGAVNQQLHATDSLRELSIRYPDNFDYTIIAANGYAQFVKAKMKELNLHFVDDLPDNRREPINLPGCGNGRNAAISAGVVGLTAVIGGITLFAAAMTKSSDDKSAIDFITKPRI